MVSTSGWTVPQWRQYHAAATPAESLATLVALVAREQVAPSDPAWISLASPEELAHQFRVLCARPAAALLPLYGVPVAVKDNIDARGFATTAACPSFAYTPTEDSAVVARLRAAGAIIVGKTNMDQFATGLVGTRSPYGRTPCAFSAEHVSGGSSAGSGVVVARGTVPLALGTDTAGSGRVPAMLNNVIGLKPSLGVFSCAGVVPACKSLDCVSVFSLTVGDAQAAMSVLAHAETDPRDPYARVMPRAPLREFAPNRKLVVAVPTALEFYGEAHNPRLFHAAVETLQGMTDAEVVYRDIAPLLELAKCLYDGPWVAERWTATRAFLATNPPAADLDPTVLGIVKSGEPITATAAFEGEYKRRTILRRVEALLANVDVLVVPTAPLNPTMAAVAAEPVAVNSRQGTYTNFCNLADMAAVAVPSGFRPDGLPFGITFVGAKFTDYALLDVAQKFLAAHLPERLLGATQQRVGSGDVLDRTLPEPDMDACIELAVVGAHLSGLPLNWQLRQCQAVLRRATTTSACYRLYALPQNGPVAKPGLRRVTEDGAEIAVEVYAMPRVHFGDFLAMVPEPLAIGSCELADGTWVKGFVCEESGYASGATDITSFGGWRAYQQHKRAAKPFECVLVANRGEIAVRMIKTLKKMGIRSVAVYSDPDKHAQHVHDADVAIALGGITAADTYLDPSKILAAAAETGAQAILPGYGFLSENADFADMCATHGVVFVGPSGDAMRALGLKHSARALAEAAGVPLVPGSGLVPDAASAATAAASLGYPVMVKSTAGGGGIGLQRVDSAADIERVFATVLHQGQAYFGDSGVFIECFVTDARHVEVQIVADGRGGALAVGERDCSLQRRNQKVIEETPAPRLPEVTRAAMCAAATSLAASMRYKGAGTVEFIYDAARDAFYFLEVNARLQVEHPVTEMCTGVDLVEWMLMIAADTPPDLSVPVIARGASMEARIYAENPVKGFSPSPGQLTEVKFPAWARVDTWVSAGTVVSSEYDPTLAKVIVHGRDRAEALAKLCRALDETVIFGCTTNLDYLRLIARSEMFADARVATSVLDSYDYTPPAVEVVAPGAYTTVQDYPGRTGYWHVGVPPSGPMDDYAFRMANRAVGNARGAPGIEITLAGPTLRFHADAVVALAGDATATLNGTQIDLWAPVHVARGDTLAVGKLTSGCRAYLAVRGGLEVGEYLGSRSTFALGNLGGHNGRVLKVGDVLFVGQPRAGCTLPAPETVPRAVPRLLVPTFTREWTVAVTCGPHGSPDFFTRESVVAFFAATWKVHYNSNRFGVRLVGPKPVWARADGGEAGLHPSNAHDYVYSLGAINFTGDEPVILTCDGPSLGGFVCQAVVAQAEMWKIGQVKPGDAITFVPVSFDAARTLKEAQDAAVASFDGPLPAISSILPELQDPVLKTLKAGEAPSVVYRQAGDRYVLVEYGANLMDLNVAYRVNQLVEKVQSDQTVGIVEMSRGVRSVLVEFAGVTQAEVVATLVAYECEIPFARDWTVPSRVIRLPMAFEDKKTLDAVTRYAETIRADAPWLPNNVDFVAQINGVDRTEIRDMLYAARFLVLGLGDVFLGAPVAVPLDPRHRYLGTKYNPSRTYTPNGTVGIGGMYMCIYTMESPGGYQLVGRTIPIWDKLALGSHTNGQPWLLTPFDQVEFYPVSEAEIDVMYEEAQAGRFVVDVVESVFDHGKYLQWTDANAESIKEFQDNQGGEKLEDFTRLIQVSNAELERAPARMDDGEKFSENAERVYSEYSGRFWKPLVAVGDVVVAGQALVVVEAMKTEMVVSAQTGGKVVKIVHVNGDMVDSGDVVAIIESSECEITALAKETSHLLVVC
ncbi:hypothetical protein BABINDRAFT_161809 [Babjeviella inositovora NRRL Y-12698]|uniref:Urea amidolyase n=1 Tax=Babjeviella inositovora NRRL Y-12698 TaxID=984486 RepID=A0A1E3QR21_9ASCO|nr:uncharacterized protein BABINDRAFT_161809 [Babjeviella inositovora NRRL Y-12698]ODQ79407.1 hypothetical protein BABINDRAFT_161809 [Babjeviella inositovora NRRL Y-12698]